MDNYQYKLVGVFICRKVRERRGGSRKLWSPWPLRGISSSLQGVWQACSPNNCSCSRPPSVDKVPPLPPTPVRPSPGPLVSVSGWQPDLTKVITTLPLPRPPAAVMTWSGRTITSRAGQHPPAPGAWLLASCPSSCQLLCTDIVVRRRSQ